MSMALRRTVPSSRSAAVRVAKPDCPGGSCSPPAGGTSSRLIRGTSPLPAAVAASDRSSGSPRKHCHPRPLVGSQEGGGVVLDLRGADLAVDVGRPLAAPGVVEVGGELREEIGPVVELLEAAV